MGSVIGYQEARGSSIITFETDVASKIKNLIVDINPIQTGAGDPSPDNIRPITGWMGTNITRCGKNLLDPAKYNTARVTVDGNLIIVKSTAYYSSIFSTKTGGTIDVSKLLPIPSDTLTISCESIVSNTDGGSTNMQVITCDPDGANRTVRGTLNAETLQLTFTCDAPSLIDLQAVSNKANLTITKFQLEIGGSATAYEAWNGARAASDWSATAGTVYGGTADLRDGTLVSECAVTTIGALTWTYNDDANGKYFRTRVYNIQGIPNKTGSDEYLASSAYKTVLPRITSIADMPDCSIKENRYNTSPYGQYIYLRDLRFTTEADLKAAMGDVQIVYRKATPDTFAITPQEIQTLIGINTIYADTGDILVHYPKTITPVETLSNVNLFDLRRNIIAFSQIKSKSIIKAYGVEWNYADPSTVLKRTGAAANFANPIPATSLNEVGYSPFDNIYPWNEMKRYNIINGEVAYSQDDAGYSETNYDTVVYIPEFYYYANKDTTNQKWNWSISSTQLEGYKKHPGSGRYVGRFHTSGSSSNVFSKSGAAPLTNITRANFRTYSHNKGNNWRQIDLATWSVIQMLYLIEFANWNSQNMLGNGQNTSSKNNTGDTTGALYHTIKRNGDSNSYRWIENLFGKLNTWIDGYVGAGQRAYFTTNVDAYNDLKTGNTSTGIIVPRNGTWITGFGYDKNCDWAFIPDASSGGSASTYVPDAVYSDPADPRILCVAGDYSTHVGLFCFAANHGNTDVSTNISSRLIYI